MSFRLCSRPCSRVRQAWLPKSVVNVVVAPVEDVALLVDGTPLAALEIHIRCRRDSRGRWWAVDQSAYKLRLNADSTPLLRLEYVREAHSTPSAHLQVHAQRGALSHLLSRTGHHAPHDMSKLHLPLGGARFRPCLEGLLQLLVSIRLGRPPRLGAGCV
jgi:hypothetical protein